MKSIFLFSLGLVFLTRADIYSQTIIWSEDFSGYADGTITGIDNNNPPLGNDWSTTYAGSGTFSVQANELRAENTGTEGVWTSEVVDISAFGKVEITVDAAWAMSSFFSGADYIRMFYILDGGSETLFFEQNSGFATIGGSATVSQVLSGSDVQIIIRVDNDVNLLADDLITFDNVTITEVLTLYSMTNGNWNAGTTWSTNDFSGSQTSCSCTPSSSETVVIGNGNTVTFNISGTTSGIDILNTGTLRWNGNFNLNISRGGNVIIESGGSIDLNGNTGNMLFGSNAVNFSMQVDENTSFSNIRFSAENINAIISGTANISLSGDLDFEQDNIVVTNQLSGTLTANRLLFDNDDCTFINDQTVQLNNNLQVNGGGDNNNVFTNNPGAILNLTGAMDFNNGNFIVNNSGIINQSGNFTDIDSGSDLFNLDGGVWNWSYVPGTPYDNAVNIILDCTDGSNTFNYTGSGNQNIVPVTYTNVGFAGSGTKTTQANLDVNGNLSITNGAQLDVNSGNDNITLGGNWANSSSSPDPFVESTGTASVTFDGITDQTVTNTNSETFRNLSVNKGGGNVILNTGTNVNIDGTLNLVNGFISLGDQSVTLGSSASITNASASSFILTNGTGELIQNNLGSGGRTGNIVYPLGVSSASYTPLMIDNSTGTSDNFSVRVNADILTEGTSGTVQTTGAIDRTWLINETSAGGSNVSLTFQWNLSNELTSFDRSNLNVIHYNGTDWEVLGTTAASGSDPYSASVSGISSFSPFGIEDGLLSPLPVELISFEANPVNEKVILNWSTASELNNDFFTVERSVDLENFEEVVRVDGNGTTSQLTRYVAVDDKPYGGVSYYRLKQTDFDGKFEYFDVARINIELDELRISIYPIPSNGETINLRMDGLDNNLNAPLRIFNSAGVLVHSTALYFDTKHAISQKINLNSKLTSGVYTMIIDADKPYIRKFTVK